MTLTIPQVRERLHALSILHGIGELADLAEATRRKPYTRPRAPAKSRHLTPQEIAEVADYALTHPNKTLHEIGTRFGVNSGRVSEALAS